MVFSVGINDAMVVSPHDGCVPHLVSIGVQDGRIAYVGSRRLAFEDARELVDGTGHVLMPGLVNGHNHGDVTVARGLGDGLTLWEQNEKFAAHNWFSNFLTPDDLFASRQLTYIEALLSGTTYILENSFWNHPRAVEAMAAVGIRGAIAMDVRPDFAVPDVLVSTEEIAAFQKECQRARIDAVIGSVSEEDFDRGHLQRIRELLEATGILATSHLSETRWRVELSQERCGMSPVQAMATFGYFDHRCLASHMVHLNAQDIQTVVELDVKVVNTPVAEMKIADGIAPIPALVEAGVKVALGTDGALWNDSVDLFGEMRQMKLLHSLVSGPNALSSVEIIAMATTNGAEAFGHAEEFGTIEEGRSADFILVDVTAPKVRPLSAGNITSALVNLINGSDVTDVFIRGERVVAQRLLQTLNADAILEQVQAAHNRIASAIAEGRITNGIATAR